MKHAILLGDPAHFRIRGGQNPYTRDRWGLKKRVDRPKAVGQWERFKDTLERLGAATFVVPPHAEHPGLVFPANAGFLHFKYAPVPLGHKHFWLSSFAGHRAGQEAIYRAALNRLGVTAIATLPFAFEGEADFFPVADFFVFTHGEIVRPGFVPALGIPPYRYRFSHRSDARNLGSLEAVVSPQEVLPVRLTDVRYYHGDTLFFAFGLRREYLLAYPPAADPADITRLRERLGGRFIEVDARDAEAFACNSFQLDGPQGPVLVMPAGVSDALVARLEGLGFPVTRVDVSEFFRKGGGSVKCLIGDLGPVEQK